MVPCSLPEARALIEAGKVKSLAIMDPKPAALFPNVPTLKAAIGSDWTMAAWRGIAAPKGMPADVRRGCWPRCRRRASQGVQGLHDQPRLRRAVGAAGEFAKFMGKSDADLGATMKAVGIAK